MTKIMEYIYISSRRKAKNLEYLNKNKIKYIISISNPDERNISHSNIAVHHFKFKDEEESDILQYINKVMKIINLAIEKKANILLHCGAGVSRSPALLVVYLIKQYELVFDDAYKMVYSKRNCCEINNGFIEQLKIISNKIILKKSENGPSNK